MRKVLLCVAVTLDSFIEGPNGEYDWCFTDQDYGLNDLLQRVDAIFYGRKSFEMMKSTGGANPWAGKKNYVFSNTLRAIDAGYELVSGNTREQVEKIKRMPGKDIWLFGGGDLTASLMNEGLVDELLLAVHPLLLGKGKVLFPALNGRIPLKLISSKPYDSGLVMMHFAVHNQKTG